MKINMDLKKQIDTSRLPVHVAVIMDGNGRWAKQKGNQRIFGHKNGVVAVREVIEAAAELGIPYVTLYAFSKENWQRPKTEVKGLMTLLVSTIHSEVKTLMKNNIRLCVIGDIDSLPKNVAAELNQAIQQTSNNTGLGLVLALSYGARWEILRAVKRIAADKNLSDADIENLDESTFEKHLSTAGIPDPELLIRTGGEQRISNFLLWQLSYAELFFTNTLWPDFRKSHFYEAIIDFQSRERRFGKTGEQAQKLNKKA